MRLPRIRALPTRGRRPREEGSVILGLYYPYNHAMNDDARIKTILSILSATYPNATIVLSYSSPWELLVAVILSAQCTDVMVNKVTRVLFQKYPTIEAYTKARLKEFEQDIKSTGFYHNKAKNILSAAALIQKNFKGQVPKTMKDMITIPGVARKTANVVLGNAYGIVEGIAVDTHVLRLSQRLRMVPIDNIGGKHRRMVSGQSTITDFIQDASPEKIEKELMQIIPKEKWSTITYQLIDHGRAICKSQHPKCLTCPLSSSCPAKR